MITMDESQVGTTPASPGVMPATSPADASASVAEAAEGCHVDHDEDHDEVQQPDVSVRTPEGRSTLSTPDLSSTPSSDRKRSRVGGAGGSSSGASSLSRSFASEDKALLEMAEESNRKLAMRRQARAEARAMRLAEKLRQVEEEAEQQRQLRGDLGSGPRELEEAKERAKMREERARHKAEQEAKENSALSPLSPISVTAPPPASSTPAPTANVSVSGDVSSVTSSPERSVLAGSTLAPPPALSPAHSAADLSEMLDVREELVALQAQYREAMLNVARLENFKAVTTLELDRYKDRVEDLEEEVRETNANYRRKHAELRESNREKEALAERCGIAEQSLAEVAPKVEELQAIVDTAEERIATAADAEAAATAKATEVIETSNAKIADVEQMLEKLETDRKVVVKQNKALEAEVVTLQQKAGALEAKLRACHDTIEDLESSVGRRRSEAVADNGQDVLQAKLARLESTNKSLKRQLEEAEDNEDQSRKEARSARQEMRKLRDEKTDLEVELEAARAQLEKFRRRRRAAAGLETAGADSPPGSTAARRSTGLLLDDDSPRSRKLSSPRFGRDADDDLGSPYTRRRDRRHVDLDSPESDTRPSRRMTADTADSDAGSRSPRRTLDLEQDA